MFKNLSMKYSRWNSELSKYSARVDINNRIENSLERIRLERETQIRNEVLVLESPGAFERQSGRFLPDRVRPHVAVNPINVHPQRRRWPPVDVVGVRPAGSTRSSSSSTRRSLASDSQKLLLLLRLRCRRWIQTRTLFTRHCHSRLKGSITTPLSKIQGRIRDGLRNNTKPVTKIQGMGKG